MHALLSNALFQQRSLVITLATVLLLSTTFKSSAQSQAKGERPAILFRTGGSEINWLVLDIPIKDEELFFSGTVLRLNTPAGTVTDTLHDATLVTHNPQTSHPAFSQQLYFILNPYPAPIEAALARGTNITIELLTTSAGPVYRYQQANHTLVVNPHPVALNRSLRIASSPGQAGQ